MCCISKTKAVLFSLKFDSHCKLLHKLYTRESKAALPFHSVETLIHEPMVLQYLCSDVPHTNYEKVTIEFCTLIHTGLKLIHTKTDFTDSYIPSAIHHLRTLCFSFWRLLFICNSILLISISIGWSGHYI